MGKLLLKFLVGAAAGLLVWAIMEPQKPVALTDAWQSWEFKLTMLLGAMIGLAVGGADGAYQGGRFHLLRSLGLGLLFGAIGSPLGYSIGSKLAMVVFGGVPAAGPTTIPARILALVPLGVVLGAAIGGASLSIRKLLQGAIGGGIGAAVGSALFDLIGSALAPSQIALEGIASGQTAEVGAVPRMVYCVALGGAIGLFIGIIEQVSRSAWVRLAVGRNEGKEWSIDLPQNFIGRSERAQVPLFGDPAVAPMHACIQKSGAGYFLMDSGAGTILNGQPVAQAPLHSGDQITVGRTTLTFLLRGGPAPVRGPEHFGAMAFPVQAFQPQPTPQPQPAPLPSQMGVPSTFGLTLVALDGPLSGKRFPLAASADIGREGHVIPMAFDNMASRRHARVEVHGASVTVTDLNSTNGTFVNGVRIQSQPISPGDQVRIGATTFRVEAG